MSLLEPCESIWLETILVSPCCREQLALASTSVLRCTRCDLDFLQPSPDWFNLIPDQFEASGADWKLRQQEMETWYRSLIAHAEGAKGCFQFDYGPIAERIGSMQGRVLDVGGGIGVTRHYLRAASKYVVLDPSLEWLSSDWSSLCAEFPCLQTTPCFVCGIGERLPFRDESFDSALALWSLNHTSDPKSVFHEVRRILVRGGRFLVVLEDMIPRWSDVLIPTPGATGEFRWPRILTRKAAIAIRGLSWPLQSDHIRILDRDIAEWIDGRFDVTERQWISQYLTYEFKSR